MWRCLEVVTLGSSLAPIAQGIERLPPEQKVAGSNPAGGAVTLGVYRTTGRTRAFFGSATLSLRGREVVGAFVALEELKELHIINAREHPPAQRGENVGVKSSTGPRLSLPF